MTDTIVSCYDIPLPDPLCSPLFWMLTWISFLAERWNSCLDLW